VCQHSISGRTIEPHILFFGGMVLGVGILIACCAAPCSAVLAPFDARGDSCFTNLEGPPVNPTAVGRAARVPRSRR
jgi:hypothetical protein